MSKGSSPRPFSVSHETYSNNYDRIFKKLSPQEIDEARAEQEEFDRILEENKRRQAALELMVQENERLGLYNN